MSEHITGGSEAPRSGRRAASAAAGYDPNDPYVREILDLAAKQPGSPDPDTVDFDQLIDEDPDAPPNFERMAVREAAAPNGLAGFAAYRPPAPRPAPGPGGPGVVDAFPVYGDIQPGALADIPVYGEPVMAAGPGTPADPSRDVGITEKPDFYDDPSAAEPDHKVRFRPGSSYSPGKRNAYRADARGVPVFAPGWTAGAVAKKFAAARTIRLSLAAVMVAAAAGMGVMGVGANAEYLEMEATGTLVPAKVVSVISESAQKASTETAIENLGVTTTETASVEFTLDGKKHRHELSATSESGTAIMGAETAWTAGSAVDLLVDPADPTRAVLVDEDQMGRINLFTLIPLAPAVLFAVTGISAHLNTRKMRVIEAAA